MATPQKNRQQPATPAYASRQQEPPLVVEPGWLLRVLGGVLVAALVCAYLALCGLFYFGQWQLVLHPVRGQQHTPGQLGLTAEDVRFGEGNALHGWWMAGDPGKPAVLMLPGGTGQASDLLERARTLQEAGLGVLLFDYRGFGQSAGAHPEEHTMEQDGEWALGYLTGPRATTGVLVYGTGVGASIAVRLCGQHHELRGLVLESPEGDETEHARNDSRARLVPFGLLFHEPFPLAAPLAGLQTPKLLVGYGSAPSALERSAADPKLLLELPSPVDRAGWHTGLLRFLDTYAAR